MCQKMLNLFEAKMSKAIDMTCYSFQAKSASQRKRLRLAASRKHGADARRSQAISSLFVRFKFFVQCRIVF